MLFIFTDAKILLQRDNAHCSTPTKNHVSICFNFQGTKNTATIYIEINYWLDLQSSRLPSMMPITGFDMYKYISILVAIGNCLLHNVT